jgi:hypothetical protein
MAVRADTSFPLNGFLVCSRELYGGAKNILASSAAKADAH